MTNTRVPRPAINRNSKQSFELPYLNSRRYFPPIGVIFTATTTRLRGYSLFDKEIDPNSSRAFNFPFDVIVTTIYIYISTVGLE